MNKCKEKYDKLTLNVYEKNEKAVNFYKKEGLYVVSKQLDEQTKEMELLMKWQKT